MWNRLLSKPSFFATLPWMDDGQALWRDVTALCTPTVLTGVPPRCRKSVHKDKRAWCARHLGEDVPVITCRTSDKHLHSGPGRVLIDDRLATGRPWQLHGGTFIHHVSAGRTLYELRRLLGSLPRTHVEVPAAAELAPLPPLPPIVVVDRVWPVELDGTQPVVGVDVEWDPAGSGGSEPIALVQLATSSRVFLLDMLNSSAAVATRLRALLADDATVKVMFGADGEDVRRLGCNIVNVVDVQEAAVDLFECSGWFKGAIPSLAKVVAAFLRQALPKTKEFQACVWSERPLTEGMKE